MGKIDMATVGIDISGSTSMASCQGTNYIVETPTGVIYCIFINASSDPAFKKSVDYGKTWSAETQLKSISCTGLAVWYDVWTDPTGGLGGLIHVVYTDSGTDDVFYRSINTASSDTLGTEYTVFAGLSTAAGGSLSIARMIGGNLICCGCIDAGTEIFSLKSTDIGINWSNISTVYEAETGDEAIVMPGWGADTQDAMILYYDLSASEVSVKYFDDSGDSVSETSILGSVVLPNQSTGFCGNMSACIDHLNSANIFVFWTAVDTANADLKCYSCTQSTQTAKTDVVLNSTDDQAFCSIGINKNNEYLYVIYYGASDGSETYSSRIRLYYKFSTDGGTNWSSENIFNTTIQSVEYTFINPFIYKNITQLFYGSLRINLGVNNTFPRTTYQLGM